MCNLTFDLLFCFDIMGSVALNRSEDATICYISGRLRKLFTITDGDCRGEKKVVFNAALLCVQDNAGTREIASRTLAE